MSNTKPPGDDDDDGTGAVDESSNAQPSVGRTGQQVDKYRLVRRLGAGGMAEVYEAIRTDHIRNRVALKLLHAYFASEPDYRRRFEQEARILSGLEHPGIVKIVDFGVLSTGESFLAMEYLQGVSLAARLADSTGDRIPVDAAVQLGFQVAGALASVHKLGVVHRDLKPSNLMLVPDSAVQPAGERVKIVDFGIARTIEADGEALTQAGRVIGTMRYMSPEQLRGEKVGAATDVFSLGLVLFECITGRSAFPGSGSVLKKQILGSEAPSLRTLQPDVQRPLSDLVRRMLAKVPAERPSMVEVERELGQLQPTGSRSQLPALTKPHWRPSRRTLPWVVLVIGGLAAVGVATYLLPQRGLPVVSRTMVEIPEGDLQMGSTAVQVDAAYKRCVTEAKPQWCRVDMFEHEQPQHHVHIKRFWIDPEPVTTSAMVRYLRGSRSRLTVRPDSDSKDPRFVELDGKLLVDLHPARGGIAYDPKVQQYAAKPGKEDEPIEQVSWLGAALYCQSVGKTLISEAQWEYVAKLLETEGARAKLSGPVSLPVGLHEWVFDEYKGMYPQCEKDCVNPVVGSPLVQRDLTKSAVVRGCDPSEEPSVSCRSTSRTGQVMGNGLTKLGFRCVRE
jgi:serine/threonine protein kinase